MVSYSDSTALSLPEDVVHLVLDKFSVFIDLVSFSMVCKEWGRLAKVYSQSTKLCSKSNKFPMLVIPKRNRKEGGRKLKGVLYSLPQEKIPTHVQCIHFPRTKIDGSRRYCFGCGHGWLAIIDVVFVGTSSCTWLEKEYESTITLFNPFTNTELPSLPPLRERETRLKVVLSDDPTLNPNDYMVVVICMYRRRKLDFIKAGQSWQRITTMVEVEVSDAIFYRGQVYAACYTGQIVSLDFNGNQQAYSLTRQARMALRSHHSLEYHNVPYTTRAYLAESMKGDLLFVQRFEMDDQTTSFKVFKLLFKGSNVEAVEVNNIGDEALFVGDNQTESVLASSVRGCQPNCIYFTEGYTKFDPYDENRDDYYKFDKVCDMGIFNLVDRSIEQYDQRYTFANGGTLTVPPPFWIIPRFKL